MLLMKAVLRGTCALLVSGMSVTVPAQAESTATNAAATIKRVQVTATNNYRLDKRYLSLQLPANAQDAQLHLLHDYVLQHDGAKTSASEFKEMLQITHWVHQRWQHDALGAAAATTSAMEILQLAEQGERFSCTEYSKVLRDVLHSYGIPARIVSLQSVDVAYGGLGSAHALVEAWSNTYNKWILLDAQWAVYAETDTIPQSIADIARRAKAQRFDTVIFKSVERHSKAGAAVATLNQDYREFIAAYFGYMSTNYTDNGQPINVVLPLDGQGYPLTLQALPRNVRVFAREPRDVYIDVNHVMLLLRFRPQAQGGGANSLDINTAQDYLDKMAMFAAVPDFDVGLQHNMPWFDHYDVAIDKQAWQKSGDGVLHWSLHKGTNRLAVRAVNAFGKIGPETFYTIDYQ